MPWLWRFHAVHHSAEEMDWLVGFRFHPIDLLLLRVASLGPLVALHVTPAGSAEAGGLRAAREATLGALLGPVEDRDAFVAGLEAVLARVTVEGAAPGRTCRLCDADACGHPERCPVTQAAGH